MTVPRRKVASRALVTVCLAIAVGIGWRWVGTSAWAATIDVSTAGEQFTTWVEPLATFTGWLLVAVPGILLVRATWAWIDEHVLGNEPRHIPRRAA